MEKQDEGAKPNLSAMTKFLLPSGVKDINTTMDAFLDMIRTHFVDRVIAVQIEEEDGIQTARITFGVFDVYTP